MPRVALDAVVFAVGVANCLYVGRLGFMPLDQSIVFDAGWRMLSGQVPYQHFVTPTAVVPGAMQAVFFALMGVTWFAYVLHAALVNGACAVLVMAILRRTGAHPAVAVVCGLATGVLFYPPMGTPYPEQHSLFFIVAALACVLVPRRPLASALGLVAAPLLVLCAVMSKQNPGLAGAAVVMAACAWPHGSLSRVQQWRSVAIGLGVSVALVGWAIGIWSAHETFITYFWTMPNEEAGRRGLTTAGALTSIVNWRIIGWAGLYWLRPLPFVLAAVAVWFVVRAFRRRAGIREDGLPLLLALGLYAVTVVLIVYTRNQVQNALGLLPLVVGFGVGLGVKRGSTGGQTALIFIVLVALALDTVRFQRQVNHTRMVLDLTYDGSRAPAPVPRALSFLRWQTAGVQHTGEDIARLLSFLESHPGNILVLGDSVYLYALAGRPSVNPNLWYHPGLTIPTGGPAADDFEQRFRQALEIYRPRYLIMESYRTWRGFVPMAYPPMRRWFDARGCREVDVAPRVQVFECQ